MELYELDFLNLDSSIQIWEWNIFREPSHSAFAMKLKSHMV